MQRFSLIHDGSEQGWQAAYLAFNISARFGAPLLALLVGSDLPHGLLAKRAAQVKVGGNAAKVAIETKLIPEISVNAVAKESKNINGLFVPRHLIPNEQFAHNLLRDLSCPLWVVSKEADLHGIGMLVENPTVQKALINFAINLSHRIQQPLIKLVTNNNYSSIPKSDTTGRWIPVQEFTQEGIMASLSQVETNLLIFSSTNFSLVNEIPINCIIFP